MRLGALAVSLGLAASLFDSVRAADYGPDHSLHFEDVISLSARREAIETFNDGLRRIAPRMRIAHCAVLIGAHPGRIEDIFGGQCRLNTGGDIELCADTGIGEFGLTLNANTSKDELAEFVQRNCPGG